MGDGPRGLQPGRQRLGLLPARPVPVPGLPLGRGRPRRDLRRPAAPLLRPRAVERAGPDPQGAPLRPDQQRGEPRRGRQGVLLLRRLDADPLVHEIPLQVPAARVPVPGPPRDESEADARGARVRAARHGDLRRRPVLRRLRRVRQGRTGGRFSIRVSVHNRGPEAARLHVLPTLWFRNTWSWGDEGPRPALREDGGAIRASHPELGDTTLSCDGTPELLFTENETNVQKLWGQSNPTPYVKDAFHRYVVSGERDAVNPGKTGTKAAARYVVEVPAGGCEVLRAAAVGRDAGGRRAVRAGVRRRVPAAALRRRRVLRPDHALDARRGRAPGPPAGARRNALDQAVLLLRPRPVAEGAPGPSADRRARTAASGTPSGSTC